MSGPRFPNMYIALDGEPASAGNGSRVARDAPGTDAIDAAHEAALRHGGLDEGAPGPRPHPRCGQGYCGACPRDPDGNKMPPVPRAALRADRPPVRLYAPHPNLTLTA